MLCSSFLSSSCRLWVPSGTALRRVPQPGPLDLSKIPACKEKSSAPPEMECTGEGVFVCHRHMCTMIRDLFLQQNRQ